MSNRQPKRGPTSFKSRHVTFLAYLSSNVGNVRDKAAPLITLAGNDTGDVEQLVTSIDDTRRLAVKLLASAWAANDEFAGHVPGQMFATDSEGRFVWPPDGFNQ